MQVPSFYNRLKSTMTTGFDKRRFYFRPVRKEKRFLFFVLDRFLGENPQMSFPQAIELAFCKLFECNPLLKKMFESDIVRHLPNFEGAKSVTVNEMESAYEKEKEINKGKLEVL